MGEQNPYAELMRLTNGYQVTQAIQVAIVPGIADLLAGGARTSDDLAVATGTHVSSLHRMLRALAVLGVFREDPDRRFSLTPVWQCLRSDAARPVGPWAKFVGRPYHWASWGDPVQTGETAFRQMYGTGIWEYRSREPGGRSLQPCHDGPVAGSGAGRDRGLRLLAFQLRGRRRRRPWRHVGRDYQGDRPPSPAGKIGVSGRTGRRMRCGLAALARRGHPDLPASDGRVAQRPCSRRTC
jgi:hypothetical protein